MRRASPAEPPVSAVPRGRLLGLAALVFLATLLAYGPALRAGFVWDDDAHVTKPALQSLHGLGRIWGELGATQQYYPVLYSAFWLEHRLWGDSPVGYHVANVLLHATAACLFGLVLLWWGAPAAGTEGRMVGADRSRAHATRCVTDLPLFAALIFALHPVSVESVAWIAEQKNTLSTVFYLLAALTYLEWREGLPTKAARPYLYWVAFALFVLAVLSKTVAATLPAALLVVAWWRRGRLAAKEDVVPLLPWLAFGAGAGLFSAWVERTYIGAQGAVFALGFVDRCLVAGRAACFYLRELFWPVNIAFIYPRWSVDAAAAWQYLFPLGAIGALAICWLVRGRSRGPLAAALFFVGSLFPTLGSFNVYAFAFSYVADHWQYLANLGIIAAVAAGLAALPWSRRIAGAGGAALLALLAVLTWRQCRMYDNVETFYRTILAGNPAAWMAHDNLGVVLAHSGRLPEAVEHYREALRLKPDSAEIYHDLGTALTQTGQVPEAIADYEQALRLQPAYAEAHYHLGSVLAQQGRLEEAVGQFEQAVHAKPGYAEAQNNLGSALAMLNRMPEATIHFEAAVRLDPDSAQARCNLAKALAQQGRMAEAVDQLRAALRIKPDLREAQEILMQIQENAASPN